MELRENWRDCQDSVDPERLVFLDETGLRTTMCRLYGWAPVGQRLVDKSVGGHWETNTLVYAVGQDGTRAAMLLDGALNGVSFAGFCEQFLAPYPEPGDLVVLDNLSSHTSAEAERAIEAVGASLVFLPPYSPDLTPIENLLSKVKQRIRGLRPQSREELVEATRKALAEITLDDIANAMEHAGYPTT